MSSGSATSIAVVLAGAGAEDGLARSTGVSGKALVPVAGRPMASYVLDALTASSRVSRIVYVGPDLQSLGVATGNAHAVPPGRGFAQSLALGLGAALGVDDRSPILVVTADLPWLTAGAVDRFMESAGDADIAYPIVSESVSRAAFPEQKRTYVRLRQGRFTGGNLMLLTPRMVGPILDLIDRFYRARKNPLALAALVGPWTLLALLLGRAHLPRLERLVSRRLAGDARAVVSEDACLAADVDTPDHLSRAGAPKVPA